MKKYIVKIDGMMCGMCEAHICDTIRKAFPLSLKVSASRKRGEAEFICGEDIDESALKKAIDDTGYMFISVESETYKKRGLFG